MPSKKYFRSLSSFLAEILGSYKVENNDVSYANSFTVDCKFSGRSFMYIRKSNGPKIEPCRTPASTDDQLEHWPLSTTLWNLFLKKLLSRFRRFLKILIRSSLNSNPSCHNLLKAFKISKKLAPTSRVGCWSKLAKLSWMNDFYMSQVDQNQIDLDREDYFFRDIFYHILRIAKGADNFVEVPFHLFMNRYNIWLFPVIRKRPALQTVLENYWQRFYYWRVTCL